mmetsp:Transcript_137114/g.273491  ORF Transcript_137114/g.273491 Transcript_137114/m.273491 type:complete len:430 (+) Transcript_137114:71-1360(+)
MAMVEVSMMSDGDSDLESWSSGSDSSGDLYAGIDPELMPRQRDPFGPRNARFIGVGLLATVFVAAAVLSSKLTTRQDARRSIGTSESQENEFIQESSTFGHETCTKYGNHPYDIHGKLTPCCGNLVSCHLERGGGEWETCHPYRTMCVERCSSENISAPKPTPGTARSYRLQSFNVWFGNHNYAAIAKMISSHVDPDIVTLQEAVADCKGKKGIETDGNPMADSIVWELNQRGEHMNITWKVANPWKHSWYWCGLNIYRSDLWEMEWHHELPLQQNKDTRGACGARFRRKADNVRVCSWGAHPAWQKYMSGKNEDPKWARDAVRKVSNLMKQCAAAQGTHTIFMGDMNSDNFEPIRRELEFNTGWKWRLGFGLGYDQIFIQEPLKTSGGAAVCPIGRPGCPLRAGCCQNCSHPEWAFSDHPPVYVDVTP